MKRSIPQRHQHSIIPQQRAGTGKFKPKPSGKGYNPDKQGILRPQSMPTMLTNNNGAIGEM